MRLRAWETTLIGGVPSVWEVYGVTCVQTGPAVQMRKKTKEEFAA